MVPMGSKSQEIRQKRLAVFRKQRLRVELYAPNRPVAVPDRLNLFDAVLALTPRHRNQAFRKHGPIRHQGMVARRRERSSLRCAGSVPFFRA